MTHVPTIKLGKTEYVVLPKADYLTLRARAGIPAGSVEAIPYTRASISSTLKAARERARLTQAGLAKAIGKSQSMVSGAESGAISVSSRYVSAVLKACGLPEDWTGPTQGGRSKRR